MAAEVLSFLSVGHLGPVAKWQMGEHVHRDFHELIVIFSGAHETRIRGQTLVARPGEVYFYPSGEPHAERALGSGPFEIAFISWRPVPDVATDRWPLKVFDREGRIACLVRWLLELNGSRGGREETLRAELLHGILCEYDRLQGRPEEELVLRVQRYIRAHLAEALSLDDLAAVAGLSPFHFSRLWHKTTGETPMRMLRRMRVEAAKALILRTPLPLKAIALQVGLGDEYHLSRVFKRLTGTAPGRWRAR